jgi:hypothetical protein
MKPFKIENNNIVVEIFIKLYSENVYTYSWYDNRTNEKIYESEKINTSSKDVVYFLGLIECIKYLQDYQVTKFIKCDNEKTLRWFLTSKVYDLHSYPEDILERLQSCLVWIKVNQELWENVIPPWKNILWEIQTSVLV